MSALFKCRPSQFQTLRRRYVSDVARNRYVTTPIFYVNAGPHIGHLYSAILADALARYNSMLGHNVFLSTGTDEHGIKVHTAAKNANLSNMRYCDRTSKMYRDMCNTFHVDYATFVRTTEYRHRLAVNYFWRTLRNKGHIYLGKYSGWYCMSDEAFLSETDLIERKDEKGNTIKVSADSGHPVEWTEEDNYKFRLSAFQDDLRHWLKNENSVKPSKYHKTLTEWVEDGTCLQDLSISRPISRMPWGIQTPEDKSQCIYVWLDALVNYLTSVNYPYESFKEFWPPAIQIIGKDILKFHGIFWPAFLIAAGLEPPRTILCHSHWLVEGEKMSKSKNNVVLPDAMAEIYTTDGLRYFLLREAVPSNDANFGEEKIRRILNAELANTLGNLISRCTGKLNPWQDIPNPGDYVNIIESEVMKNLMQQQCDLRGSVQKSYEEGHLHHVVDAVMSMLYCANQLVDHHKPWVIIKRMDDPQCMKELKAVLAFALESARLAALILYPISPQLMTNLLDSFGIPKENRTWEDTIPRWIRNVFAKNYNYEGKYSLLFRKIRRK